MTMTSGSAISDRKCGLSQDSDSWYPDILSMLVRMTDNLKAGFDIYFFISLFLNFASELPEMVLIFLKLVV